MIIAKITTAVLVLLGQEAMNAFQMTELINVDVRFSSIRAKWQGQINVDQVYAAMSSLRSKGRASSNFIQPVSGQIGKGEKYHLTGYGEQRLRALQASPHERPAIALVETVNHPAHYGGDTTYEAIKVIEAWGLNFHRGNAVKYLSRAGHKGSELEDLKKARWYLDREIANMEAR